MNVMRRYGHNDEADRVSTEFLSTVIRNFDREGTIREKYNVGSEADVKAGYTANVTGFGWTNGTFVELLDALPPGKFVPTAQQAATSSNLR